MSQILLVRHGETNSNVEDRFQGQHNIPLNAQGQNQARQLGEFCQQYPISHAFSSPLDRAESTAQIALGLSECPLTLIPDLQELSHGDWEGRLVEEVRQQDPFQFYLWKTQPFACRKPNGEALQDFAARVIPAWQRIVQGIHPHETVLVVTHKFVIQVILCYTQSLDLSHFWQTEPDNCAITILNYHNGMLNPHIIHPTRDLALSLVMA